MSGASVADWLAHVGWFDPKHASEWINGLTGAGGAILGSVVTITWTEWFNRRTRRREKRQKFGAAAFAAFHKLNHINSIAATIRNHLRESIAEARKKPDQPICLRVRPVAGMSGPIEYTVDELYNIAQMGKPELINTILSTDQNFNSLMNIME